MKLEYCDQSSDGTIQLMYDVAVFRLDSFEKQDKDTLTIAMNRGKAMEVQIDDQSMIFGANEALVLNAGQSFTSKDTSEMIFWRFNRKFYCIIDHDKEVSCVGLLFYGHSGTPQIQLDDGEVKKLELLFQVFKEEFDEPADNLKGEMLRTMLKRLIVKLTRLYKNQVDMGDVANDDLDVVRRFNLLVEQHFKKMHQVQDYASLIHKSPKTISNLFSKHSGKSPLEVIHERLLLEAKRMLIYSNKTTKEIAYEIGFRDIPTFSRFFKKHMHLSPSNYRVEKQNMVVGKN